MNLETLQAERQPDHNNADNSNTVCRKDNHNSSSSSNSHLFVLRVCLWRLCAYRIIFVWAHHRESMVHVSMAGFIRTDVQHDVPHCCSLPQAPVADCNCGRRQGLPLRKSALIQVCKGTRVCFDCFSFQVIKEGVHHAWGD